MAIKRNYWTSLVDYPLADFGIDFSNGLNIEDHISFVKEYLILSHKYAICKVDVGNDSNSFFEYLLESWNKTGMFRPSYLPGYKYYSTQFSLPFTSLSFYEKESIVQRDVSLICNNSFTASYIHRLQMGGMCFIEAENIEVPKWISNHLRAPVSFTMYGAERDKESDSRFRSLTGSVRSDIWLDRVNKLKVWNEDGSSYEIIEESDNTELAMLNTPRLNGFLRDLRMLGDRYGGTWFFESNIQVVDEHAIPINGEVLYYSDDLSL